MRLTQYSRLKLLIVDELGYLQLDLQAGQLFFPLISRRYEQGSVLISSNRPVEVLDEVFGDQVVAAAILDRLLHHSHLVTIRGDSYRLRDKRRSGLKTRSRLNPTTSTPETQTIKQCRTHEQPQSKARNRR
jgi:DNA replication protein DnaC